MAMILNPNINKRKEIGKRIVASHGYCPCVLVRNDDTKCPCLDFRTKQKCICGLYIEEGEN
ncbi:hypothetical protein [Clostridium paraputrificum]|uniref:hypothetical protein n=1 Tax=Clostridium paraputrificum TaxID=29363 RepID=UPI0018A0D1B8|nr:hypothetical protein [Clostridium paraputrificum]